MNVNSLFTSLRVTTCTHTESKVNAVHKIELLPKGVVWQLSFVNAHACFHLPTIPFTPTHVCCAQTAPIITICAYLCSSQLMLLFLCIDQINGWQPYVSTKFVHYHNILIRFFACSIYNRACFGEKIK